MFQLAVVGPVAANGLGVARQCLDCERLHVSYSGSPCFGFGPGCMEYRPRGAPRDAGRAECSKRTAEPLQE
jgi:hypothetical protein